MEISRNIKLIVHIFITVFLAIYITSVQAGITNIYDGTFDDADWRYNVIFNESDVGISTPATTQQNISGGNPGAYQQGAIHWGSSDLTQRLVAVSHFLNAPNYNPSTQGGIDYLDFSFDFNILGIVGSTPAMGAGLLLKQDGNLFFKYDTFYNENSWLQKEYTNLTSGDFLVFDVAASSQYTAMLSQSATGTFLDFTSGGTGIEFGYIAFSSTGNPDVLQTYGVDNYNLKVSSIPATVPEPSTIALIVIGSIGVMAFRRKRTELALKLGA